MVIWLVLLAMASECIPKDLVLMNGEVLHPDCGWTLSGEAVLVEFKNHHFYIKKEWVNWTATHAGPVSRQTPTVSKEGEEWDQLVSETKPKESNQPVVLDNHRLEEYVRNGTMTVTRKKRKTPPKVQRTDQLVAVIAQLENQKHALQAQLDAEITWHQAKFLMAQIDRLDQLIKEKRYWLRRIQEELARKKANLSRSDVQSETHAAEPSNRDQVSRESTPIHQKP